MTNSNPRLIAEFTLADGRRAEPALEPGRGDDAGAGDSGGEWGENSVTLPTIEELKARGEPMVCECCDAADVPLDVYQAAEPARRELPYLVLCQLCAGTEIGTMHEYRHQHNVATLTILRTICFVGNEILKEIRRGRETSP